MGDAESCECLQEARRSELRSVVRGQRHVSQSSRDSPGLTLLRRSDALRASDAKPLRGNHGIPRKNQTG
jgi:hypothetical protein